MDAGEDEGGPELHEVERELAAANAKPLLSHAVHDQARHVPEGRVRGGGGGGGRVKGLGFRVWGLGFGVWGLGFRVKGSGFGV